jgi:hypothetical protein
MSWNRFDRLHPKDGETVLFMTGDRSLWLGTFYEGNEKNNPSLVTLENENEIFLDGKVLVATHWRRTSMPTWWDDFTHPVWSFGRVALLCVALVVILYFTAKDFDETELRTVIGLFLFGGAQEGVFQFIGKLFGRKGS